MAEEATLPGPTDSEPELEPSLSGALTQRANLLGLLIIDSVFLVLAAAILLGTTKALERLPLQGLDLWVVRVAQAGFALATVGFLLMALVHDLLVAVARLRRAHAD